MENRDTLLIVDDLEMNRVILSNIFKKKYKIVEAASGFEALNYIRENSNKIIAILLDLVMPEINGIEVLETMKNENIGEDVPVFIITADNSEEIMYKAYELGVKDIIEKPFVPYFLRKRIENVIELYEIKENQTKLILNNFKEVENLYQNFIETLTYIKKLPNTNEEIGKKIENIENQAFNLVERLGKEREVIRKK